MTTARASTHQPHPSTSAAISTMTPMTKGAGVESTCSRDSRRTAFMSGKLYRRAGGNGGGPRRASAAEQAAVEGDDDCGVLGPGVRVRRWGRRGDRSAVNRGGPDDLPDPGVRHRGLEVDDALGSRAD